MRSLSLCEVRECIRLGSGVCERVRVYKGVRK